MADTVQTQYIYPPNWDGNPPENGTGGWKRVIVNFKYMSGGTDGETDVRKLDISQLRCVDGSVPTRLAIDKIEGIVNGLNLLIEFDRTPHYEVARFNGSVGGATFCLDYEKVGGLVDPSDGTDGTGDLLFTASSVASADSYDITIYARLKS